MPSRLSFKTAKGLARRRILARKVQGIARYEVVIDDKRSVMFVDAEQARAHRDWLRCLFVLNAIGATIEGFTLPRGLPWADAVAEHAERVGATRPYRDSRPKGALR